MNKIIRFDGELLKKTVNEFVRVNELQGVPWGRFTELNRLLRGFRSHEMTVLSGHTGTGKTTFLCEYSLDLAEQGVKTLWGSFEMPLRKIGRTLLQQYAGEPLASLSAERVLSWAQMFKKNVPIHFMDFHGSQNEAEVLKIIGYGVQKLDIQHVVIDNLQFLLGSSGNYFEERFQKQDKFIQSLRTFVNKRGAHLTLVVHPRKEDFNHLLTISSLYGGGKISQEADTIMLLQTETDSSFPKKYMQVVKNRYDGTLGKFDLRFHTDRLSYRPQPRQLTIPSAKGQEHPPFTSVQTNSAESSFA